MILTLDVGNTQLSGGVYRDGKIVLTFRCATTKGTSSDELGIFLRSVLRENGIDSKLISDIALCSVVPSLNYALTSACVKYFGVEPLMIQISEMAELAKAAGLNIDYFPTNFVVQDGLLYYVDYECNQYMEEWNMENWGIKYWRRTAEFEEYLENHT